MTSAAARRAGPARPRRRPRAAARRGVILLVVLVLLALFTMMLITFVIATVGNRQGVTMSSRVEQTGDSPSALLHRAFLQVVRGPRNSDSVMGAHSLLEDIYGHRGIRGTVTGTPTYLGSATPGTGQIAVFSSTLNLPANEVPPTFAFYNGRVLTMLSGTYQGRSTRIVGYDPTASSPNHQFQILAFDGQAPSPGDTFLINGRPFSGTGFGFQAQSFDKNASPASLFTRLLDARDSDPRLASLGLSPGAEYALLPNHRRLVFYPSNNGVATNVLTDYLDPAGPGGANEDYDAPDFQNMLLAMRVWAKSASTANHEIITVLPSLHRPELISYWQAQLAVPPVNKDLLDPTDMASAALLRKILMRPLGVHPSDLADPARRDKRDHPQFTGSNRLGAFDPILGPWDVDNDGDGLEDSIWVDLGMPVQTAPDGRRYKPLFAIQCIDMDGKLNLNAHTSWRHAPSTVAGVPSRFDSVPVPVAQPAPNSVVLPVGQGYGPPEISLSPLFDNPSPSAPTPTGELTRLLGGDTSLLLDGRYGEVHLWNDGKTPSGLAPLPGISGIDDPQGWLSQLPYPQTVFGSFPQTSYIGVPLSGNPGGFAYDSSVPRNGFVSPPDYNGNGMIALDLRGQPLYIDYPGARGVSVGSAGFGERGEMVDDPYELDLSETAPGSSYNANGSAINDFRTNGLTGTQVDTVDSPFTVPELERILRPNDIDTSSLPDRLLKLAPQAFTSRPPAPPTNAQYPESAQLANLLTTHGFDVPTPSMVFSSPALAAELFQLATHSGVALPPLFDSHITQLVQARMVKDNPTKTAAEIGTLLRLSLQPARVANKDTQLQPQPLVGFELLAGEKLNVNRTLGDGQDDNDNGVVDEAEEADQERGWSHYYGAPGITFDANNDGLDDQRPWRVRDPQGRQLLARHLYVLMMLLKDDAFMVDLDGDNTKTDAETAQWFAQWAVNIVDFRDADSAMTSFEYDVTPFRDDDNDTANGTWDVDGIVDFAPPKAKLAWSRSDDAQTYRGLVWGCERPELVITETLATHDRRTRNTKHDSTHELTDRITDPTNIKDGNFDQVRRPVGTLVVELFNPNPPLVVGNQMPGPAPNQLYTTAPSDAAPPDGTGAPQIGVNLAQVVPPDASGNPHDTPIWRLVTVRRTAGVPYSQLPRRTTLPAAQIDRIVYFTTSLPTEVNEGPGIRSFYAQTAAVVPPNHYAVVAAAAPEIYPVPSGSPRYVTHLGIRHLSGDMPPNASGSTPIASVENRYARRIQLSPAVNIESSNGGTYAPYGAYASANDIKPPVGVPIAPLYFNAAGGLVQAGNTAVRSLRWSLTEPSRGYPVYDNVIGGPTNRLNENAFYVQNDPTKPIPTLPYDEDAANFPELIPARQDETNRRADIIGAGDNKADTTRLEYNAVYLQRLANPLAQWDANQNPYIIVDALPVDLTTYNSEKDPSPAAGNEEFVGLLPPVDVKFDSRRRGPDSTKTSTTQNNIWYRFSLPTGVPTNPGTFASPLPLPTTASHGATLGYLNSEYGAGYLSNRWTKSSAPVADPAFRKAEYRGDPNQPFPWLTWNDRPYVSAKELMLVPMSSPSSLLTDVTLIDNAAVPDPFNVADAPTPPPPPLQGVVHYSQFGHLPNVFHSPDIGMATTPSPNFYRLFEYLHVPSRFTGTDTWLAPTDLSSTATPPHPLHPPFNRVSRFREPGKVNINTIFDPWIWQGIMDEQSPPNVGMRPPWRHLYDMIWASRQGYGNADPTAMDKALENTGYVRKTSAYVQRSNSAFPTVFVQPFRSYAGNALVPIRGMRNTSPGGKEREVSSTFLRSAGKTPPQLAEYPLFRYPGASIPMGKSFSWSQNPGVEYDNPERNPYFTYQAFRRLDNLLTTRSNVYAIWITVGYFEVSPHAIGPGHPDGWELGQELGADTGDIHRHRAFYMYDRTIPVGFERGENHNVERGVLVERFIE